MSSIIKHNRINQLGTIQLGEPKKQEDFIEEIQIEKHDQVLKEVAMLKHEADKEVRRLLDDAKEKAKQMMQEAEEEKAALIQKLQIQVDEGKKSIEEERIAILESANQQSKLIIEGAKSEKERILQEIEPEVVTLLKTLLTRIIDKQVVGNGLWLGWIVRKMIRTENIAETITIWLSEASYEAYGTMLREQLENFSYAVQIEIDRQLSDFACTLETSTGTIYYNVEEGLEEVLAELEMLQSLSS